MTQTLAKVTLISQSQRIRDVKWVNIHILKLQTPCTVYTAAWLSQLGERWSAERDVRSCV